MTTVRDFERQVWAREGVRIVVRAPYGARVKKYDYQVGLHGYHTISRLYELRLRTYVDGKEVAFINGFGEMVHYSTKVETVRKTYESRD